MDANNQHLLEQLFHLEWLLRRYHMQQYRDQGPLGSPHQGQGRILALLRLKSEISQKELAKILDIRSQSLGELLVKLERSGYITRTPSTADRRSMDIQLTEAGRKASEKDDDLLQAESFFSCLSTAEQATLSDYLERLVTSLNQQLGTSESEPGFGLGSTFRGNGFGFFRREGGRPPADMGGFGRFWDRDHPRPPFGDRRFTPPHNDDDNDDA